MGKPDLISAVVDKLHGSIKALGDQLIASPLLTLIVVFIGPLLTILFGLLGGPSAIFLYFNPVPPHLKETAAVEFTTKLLLDLALTSVLTFGWTIFVSLIVVKSLMDNIALRDEKINAEKQQLTEERRTAWQTNVTTLQQAMLSAKEESVGELASHIRTFLPTWSVITSDSSIRDELKELGTVLQQEIQGKPKQQLIITRSLIEGLRRRFTDLAHSLPDAGAIMEPSERRGLTNELYENTGTYCVVHVGLYSLREGELRWHEEYLQFLQDAAKRYRGNVAWVFLHKGDASSAANHAAVKEVLDLGMECFVVPKFDEARAMLNISDIESVIQHGPFVEVFGSEFVSALKAKRGLEPSASVTWKSTNFGLRSSGSKRATPIPVEEAIRLAGSEGVWFADNVLKIVKASNQSSQTRGLCAILDYICKNRIAVSASAA